MLILGRSPNLVLALLAAAFNVAVAFHLGGFDPTPDQITIVNAFLFALVAFVANSDSVTTAAADAARKRNGLYRTRRDDTTPTPPTTPPGRSG